MHAVHVHDRDISRRPVVAHAVVDLDRKSTRLNSSHSQISYAVFCLKKKKIQKSFTILPRIIPLASKTLTPHPPRMRLFSSSLLTSSTPPSTCTVLRHQLATHCVTPD